MRFYLFDKVVEFTPGESAVGIKNVSSQEEFLIDHYERFPVMPSPLVVEALAQLGGWAVTTSGGHLHLAILVRVKGLVVSGDAVPGDQITLQVNLEDINEFGANISARAKVNDREILKAAITYVLYEIPEAERGAVKAKYTAFMN